MKITKMRFAVFKFFIIVFLIGSTALALYIHHAGRDFDLIKEIHQLQDQNRRDDALDLVQAFKYSDAADPDELRQLQDQLEYSVWEKAKAFAFDGAICGDVYDHYSGMGAIGADLVIIGDVRDLSIQSWYHLTDSEKYDQIIMLLSAAGIGLSSTAFVNGTNALAKNTFKYLKRVPSLARQGLLCKFLSGKMSAKDMERIWDLSKKTNIVFPVFPIV